MQSLIRCFDAARPPQTAPAGVQAVLGYVGGPRAARVWTLPEWHRFAGLIQFPCYVPDLAAHPGPQAAEAVRLTAALGWWAGLQRAIVADTETTVSREWWAAFAGQVVGLGYIPVDYGSLSCVLGNAAALVWSARWDGIPAVPAGQTIVAHQFAAGLPCEDTQIDLSVLHPDLAAVGGRGPRRPI